MVKIVNPLGDVKIGRQGQVVYQRKYGEQIRRQVAPKRAIASQAQIEHRQLYRAALDWRSQLSLANRRYLEGYTYAHGVVDSYHIPLGWSKFALKLYLEKVKFALTDISIIEATEEEALFEYYTEGITAWINFYSNRWRMQSFTPQVSHNINKVALKLRRTGEPPTGTVSIRATNGEGLPIVPDLVAVDFDPNEITTDSEGEEKEFTCATPYPLVAETLYAIVIRIPGGTDANSLEHAWDTTGDYIRGRWSGSNDSGDTWAAGRAEDAFFKEWGVSYTPGSKTGILHIKHPSLSTVIQKRGELTIQAYEGLSSLDEEYLTGQVGLDAELGDLIEATTLPGIKYSYLVK